jgi:AcrR family transcriptional regulator
MAETALSRSAFYQYFQDVHDLMRTLLAEVSDEVFGTTGTWFRDTGDPVLLLNESLAGLVEVCYRVGPILKASDAAAATGESFNEDWTKFKKKFDDSVTARIKADQAQGLIPMFDARPVANALNRLNAYTVIEAFGEKPRRKPAAVSGAMTRVWVSTLYGPQWLEKGTSTLLRK